MNKTVSPKQMELTSDTTREELLLASAPHIDPESPAFKESLAKVDKIAREEAERAVSAPGPAMGGGMTFGYRPDISDDDFNWDSTEESAVILREQRATAAYRNKAGELIIRQRASWDEDQDTFVFISPENETAFMEGLAQRARK